jgi:GDP/UDP-N,N'-diacetylbacillosamine 2-epimerase (hydrolysing)
MKKDICFVTGTRAEYGLLRPLMQRVARDDAMSLRIIATGAHLSPEFGNTYRAIEEDGFEITKKIEILLSSDTSCAVNKSIGLGIISFGEYFSDNRPDLVILLGDRFETFAAATAAAITKLPIAHIHGGETTEGAADEFLRHSITKMSQLHLTSTEEYARRVVQMGEDPRRVHNVGALGVENILNLPLLSRRAFEERLGLDPGEKYALITFHPATLEKTAAGAQFSEILAALDGMPDLKLVFTKANADSGGRAINALIDEFVARRPSRGLCYDNMGQILYLSAMKHCALVIGNSSSGIIEAPSLRVPTVNIGSRQKGRVQARSIINCAPLRGEVSEAIRKSLDPTFLRSLVGIANPYGDGSTSQKILALVKDALSTEGLDVTKSFLTLSSSSVP